MISVVMVQYNNSALTRASLASLWKHHPGGVEVIVVDNGSRSGQNRLGDDLPGEVRLLSNVENVGFSAANNQAARCATGPVLCFLNNDTLFTANVFSYVESLFERDPDLGVLGPRLLYADGSFQLSAGRLPGIGREAVEKLVYRLERQNTGDIRSWLSRRYSGPLGVEWVTGAALFIRRKLFEQLGGFDERFFMYFEDKDLCARALNTGYRVMFDPTVSLIHLKGGSSTPESEDRLRKIYRESQIIYYEAHRPPLERHVLRLYLSMKGERPRGGPEDPPPFHGR